MSNFKKRLIQIDLGFNEDTDFNENTTVDAILNGAEGILAGKQGHHLAQWLAEKFNHNFNEYDKAIDAVYNQTHVGGSAYHHLIDGQHSIWGAFKAVQDVHLHDSWAKELGAASEHLLRDTASVSGINPFFTLTPDQFNKMGDLVSKIGISKAYLADALTINGPELIGGSIALVSSIILAKTASPEKLSYFSGGCLFSSVVSANPMLLPIAAGSMVYAIRKGKNKKKLIVQAGKGSLVSGSALLASSLVGGPIWLGCVAGFMTAIAVSQGLDNPKKAFERNKKLIQTAQKIFRKVAHSFSS